MPRVAQQMELQRTSEGSVSGDHMPKILHSGDFSFLINFITNPFIFQTCFRISRQVDSKAGLQMQAALPSAEEGNRPALCLRVRQACVGSTARLLNNQLLFRPCYIP